MVVVGGVKMIGLIPRTQPTLCFKKLCNTNKHPPAFSLESECFCCMQVKDPTGSGFKVSLFNNSSSSVFVLNNGEPVEHHCLFLAWWCVTAKCWPLAPKRANISAVPWLVSVLCVFALQGCSWSVIFVDLDAHNRNRQTLCSLLPRESRSHVSPFYIPHICV